MGKFDMIIGCGGMKKELFGGVDILKNKPLASDVAPKPIAHIMNGRSCNMVPVV